MDSSNILVRSMPREDRGLLPFHMNQAWPRPSDNAGGQPNQTAGISSHHSPRPTIPPQTNNIISNSNKLSDWGLPTLVVNWFKKRGIAQLFDWQVECLLKGKVLHGENLVYSAPTSAGKTMVADFLVLKQVLERRRKALIIQPFISVAREKATSLKSMLWSTKARVGSFCGTYYTPGGLAAVSIAVCTIEKANNLINKLIQENKLFDLGIIVVDELHNLGDRSRGFLLELLLTKVLYFNLGVEENKKIQIVGLSATLPNLVSIARWLQASLHVTDFRPIPLVEKIKLGSDIYLASDYAMNSEEAKPITKIDESRFRLTEDPENIAYLCLETILDGHSVLVFCESRRECEILANLISRQIKSLGNMIDSSDRRLTEVSVKLRNSISTENVLGVLQKLKNCPSGLDHELKAPLQFGVAFHHAGLTSEEREIIEDSFRTCAIRVLMATSTLSSGVNLPARRVIIKTPLFLRQQLDPMVYRQMIGRAGRKGVDTAGESILICRSAEEKVGKSLVASSLRAITSCLGERFLGDTADGILSNSLKKALLEVIANNTAKSREQIDQYLDSSYWFSSSTTEEKETYMASVSNVLTYLAHKGFIEEIRKGTYKSTRLGNAVLASGLAPEEALELVQDLTKAREGFCLVNDLHIIYQVTPNDLSRQQDIRDWIHYYEIWNSLSEICQYVGQRVGIDEGVIARRSRGFMASIGEEKERVYRRFRVALALNDIINEVPMHKVVQKYRISRANLQTAQRSTAQFAGVMNIFCQELGYDNIAALVSPLEPRLNFSCQRDLLDLVRLNVSRPIARSLFENGFKNIVSVARGDVLDIEFALHLSRPFKKEKDTSFKGDNRSDLLKIQTRPKESDFMWVPELAKTMSVIDYAQLIVQNARSLIEIELDVNTNISTKRKDIELEDDKESKKKERLAVAIDEEKGYKRRITASTSKVKDSSLSSQIDSDPSFNISGHQVDTSHSEDHQKQCQEDGSLVVKHIGHDTQQMKKFLDKWTTHSSISLILKVDSHQVNNPIGAKVAKRCKRKNKKDRTLDDSTSTDSGQEEGLPLKLEIDNQKHILTHLYACFDTNPTVYVVDTTDGLEMIQSNLKRILGQPSMICGRNATSRPLRLYTLDIMTTYKVLYAAFHLDQATLSSCIEWHGFDVAWWMVNNCPLRDYRSNNYSISSIIGTKYASEYQHLLESKSSNKRKNKTQRNFDLLAAKAAMIEPLLKDIIAELEKRHQTNAYSDVEVPCRTTMACMTIHGMGIDLKAMHEQLKLYEALLNQMNELAKVNYSKSSKRLLLTSPRDVARVMFEELDLKKHLADHITSISLAKDSTCSEILKILAKYHPFPKLVQDFRKVTKASEALQAVGTYCREDCELAMVRVFGQCDFWQLTGRISMHSPDLFLINRNFEVVLPEHEKNKEEVIECVPRKCFIPYDDWQFVSADYSQLELRLLAHFSEDENLLKILNRDITHNNADVFKTVASQIYQIEPEEVTSDKRQHAKQICYGIIYGMGIRSLAIQLGVNTDEAEVFSEKFHHAFPNIKKYTNELIEECEELGYVESLMGRRRAIDGINSEESKIRAKAERVAINTRIQSSASDIIKLAMNSIDKYIIEKHYNQARLVLEMHDELIYEVNPSSVNKFSRSIKHIMESLPLLESLRVKLLVNLKKGPNWAELEKIEH